MKISTFKTIILLACLAANSVWAQGPYAPAAGNSGSTAIAKDSSIFVAWATGIEVQRGFINISDTSVSDKGTNKASYGHNGEALNKAEGTSADVMSLGDAGVATLTFDRPIQNGTGPDFAVFENGFDDPFLELAFVEVSSNGVDFVRFPAVSLTQDTIQKGGFDPLDPTQLYNLAGKYKQGFGTPFDLEELKNEANLDVDNIRFVRIIDVVGSIDSAYGSKDSQGNLVNDGWPASSWSSGFDLVAVGVINGGITYQLSTFNDLVLAKDSFWNGSDGSGKFLNGTAEFMNSYNPNFNSWGGFAYTNLRDDSTFSFSNKYSAITIGGLDSTGSNHATGFESSPSSPAKISFKDDEIALLKGAYVTNSAQVKLSLENGDSFAKKFGGATGDD